MASKKQKAAYAVPAYVGQKFSRVAVKKGIAHLGLKDLQARYLELAEMRHETEETLGRAAFYLGHVEQIISRMADDVNFGS